MEAKLLRSCGTDLDVVNAARVSFDKESEWTEDYVFNQGKGFLQRFLSERDTKLIHYLASHEHWSPFAHCFMTFRIKAPIFVARQLVKHQVGLAWNEVSRRYVDSEPEFYHPKGSWRAKSKDKKQGSEDTLEKAVSLWADTKYNELLKSCTDLYQGFIANSIAPEQARMILPQSMFTQWVWSGSLFAFARVCNLRCKPDAQLETKMVADQISDAAKSVYPVSWKELCG